MNYFKHKQNFRTNNYVPWNAASYALRYALNPNPMYRYFPVHGDGGGDCTNFISQCLKAGGAPYSYGSSPWWYNNKGTVEVNDDSWSISWSVANSLYWTLNVRKQNNMAGLKGTEVSDMGMLELGDLIFYEDYKGTIYHSVIITSFAYSGGSRVPLISQHSFEAVNISYYKPKAKRMHFMKVEVT